MIRSLRIREDRVRIELRMWRGKGAAVKIVILLFPMVGQRSAFRLPAARSSVISKRGEKKSVHLAALLKDVQYLVHAFIDERDGADLNSNHLLGSRSEEHTSELQSP